MKRHYYVYVLTNWSRTLYTGITNDLVRRVSEHKEKRIPGFTARYKIDQLVHYELFGEIWEALEREKQIKGWTRAKKIALVEANNPTWDDLSESIREHESENLIGSEL